MENSTFIIDGFVKSLKTSLSVFPAEAGIQYFHIVLDACLRRHDGISDFLRVCHYSIFAFSKFFLRFNWPFFWPAAPLNTDPPVAENLQILTTSCQKKPGNGLRFDRDSAR
jgi:hypothetical protein